MEEKVKSGEWPIGHQLPTEQELAKLFAVSTITVKRAILELVNKGYVYRQQAVQVIEKVKEEGRLGRNWRTKRKRRWM